MQTDDPIHGDQEGRFFHGYYQCYCYLLLYIFCCELLLAKLRPANIDASAGAKEEVAFIVAQIRQSWPDVDIWLRADFVLLPRGPDGLVRRPRRSLRFRPRPHLRLEAWMQMNCPRHRRKPRTVANPNASSRNCATRRGTAGLANAAWWPRRSIFPKAKIRATSSPR